MFQLLKVYSSDAENFRDKPKCCCHCGHETGLRARQLIRRMVRFIEKELVHQTHILIVLWRCGHCHRSFRKLPPFLEPLKRFITPTILEKVSKVLTQRRKHYRDTAHNEPPNKTAIVYAKGDGSKFSHTSVWRWIQWMGVMMSRLLSHSPEMASNEDVEDFTFDPFQALTPETTENLYLARRFWLGQHLVS